MYRLNQEHHQRLLGAAQLALGVVTQALEGESVGKGIYLRIFQSPNPEGGYRNLIQLDEFWVGGENATNYEKLGAYWIVSMEKAIRTAMNVRALGHLSSWESRDPTEQSFREKFGGAVWLECVVPAIGVPIPLVFSASGLPEVGDEAVTILTPLLVGWKPSRMDIELILKRSGNELATKLFQERAHLAF